MIYDTEGGYWQILMRIHNYKGGTDEDKHKFLLQATVDPTSGEVVRGKKSVKKRLAGARRELALMFPDEALV
jgi:hypothetical protein